MFDDIEQRSIRKYSLRKFHTALAGETKFLNFHFTIVLNFWKYESRNDGVGFTGQIIQPSEKVLFFLPIQGSCREETRDLTITLLAIVAVQRGQSVSPGFLAL